MTPPVRRVAPHPIRRLDPSTVEKIAAGEVVERPASVVKELVENSIDAGATGITVRLDGGGLRAIEVADDGGGIPADELALALERHATSKLAPDGPIDRISSLGFRGEALAAIGAVSRLTVVSRPPGQEVGEGIAIAGGELGRRFASPRAPGTTVTVKELFFNTPARRKFLKSPASEQTEVVRTVERLFLAHPRVALRLESEGAELGVYPGTSSLRDAAARVLGTPFLEGSFHLAATLPGGRIEGFLGAPSRAASTSSSLYLSVNDRAVVSRSLAQAVRVGFGDTLPRSRFPVGVVHLTLDPDRVDVNVHPTKREVRLASERDVAGTLLRSTRESLLGAPVLAQPVGVRSPAAPPGPRTSPDRSGALSRTPTVVAREQRRLDSPGPASAVAVPGRGPSRPRLELLGPLHALYWVATSDDGLVLVDQHAASERLLYEALRQAGALARQVLVEPVTIEITGVQRAALDAYRSAVAAGGFDIEPFGPHALRVRAVPSYRARRAPPEAVRELLDDLAEAGPLTAKSSPIEERTAATLACHAAIRAGDVVEPTEIARILDRLAELPGRPRTCPHGRPIMVQIPRSRLDQWFLRSGT